MEFGVSLPGRGPLATPDSILQLATKADALGYDSLFVTDHVVLPASMARSVYPYSSSGQLPAGAPQDYNEPLAVHARVYNADTARIEAIRHQHACAIVAVGDGQ